jgi:hypothetical protein
VVAGGSAARSEEQLPLKASRAFSECGPKRQVLLASTFLKASTVHADQWHHQTSIVM